MDTFSHRVASLAVVGLAVGLAGCANHISQEQLDTAIADVRADMEPLDARISDNAEAISQLQTDVDRLRQQLEQLRSDFDAHLEDHPEGLAVSLPVHFEFDESEIRPVDEPILNAFAEAVSGSLGPNAVVTVEGFADPAGSDAYNRRLGEQRAQAVKDYLVSQGLSEGTVKAVSYGESRLVNNDRGPGRSGLENRRVTFVIDFGGEIEGGGMQ